CQHYYSTPFTF
nr:immunoglobulin light chain junction region [Macaca mulatta]MPN82703.1 immunoglobulin light chain junction region [Macaca mulatta]